MDTARIVTQENLPELSEQRVLSAVKEAFNELATGTGVQPLQSVTLLPHGGDAILYQGVLANAGLFAIKVSPYLPQPSGAPIITAWTLVLDLKTGNPVLLIDSKTLTAERTAATSALAIDLLSNKNAKKLAIIGFGQVGQAHARYAQLVRNFEEISVYTPSGVNSALLNKLGPQFSSAITADEAARDADVVMLCTSAAEAVIDVGLLKPGVVVTSVSTNAPRAHEIDPASLGKLDVYCDDIASARTSAGEFIIASEQGLNLEKTIRGDIAGLLSGKALEPTGNVPVFFRSIGLGIEDAAVAHALLTEKDHNEN